MGKSIAMNINPIIHLWFDWDSIDLRMTQPGLPSSWSLGLVVFRASQPCWTSSSSRHIFFFSQQVARAKMVCFTAKTHIMPSVDTIAPTFCWVVHSGSSNSRTGKTILFHRWLVALPEDTSSISSTHVVSLTMTCNCSSGEGRCSTLFLASLGIATYVVFIHTDRHTH